MKSHLRGIREKLLPKPPRSRGNTCSVKMRTTSPNSHQVFTRPSITKYLMMNSPYNNTTNTIPESESDEDFSEHSESEEEEFTVKKIPKKKEKVSKSETKKTPAPKKDKQPSKSKSKSQSSGLFSAILLRNIHSADVNVRACLSHQLQHR